jgi:cytochrome oxidase assembly protein ShyY1
MPRRPEDEPDEHWRMTVNLLAVIVVLIVLGLGFWILRELNEAKKAQECLATAARHQCRQISAP